ncbi:MAG TPA: xanthine dehydrogenase family protein molybdopterin-binding subunit, partial [Candidatus Elarobacter sp.]
MTTAIERPSSGVIGRPVDRVDGPAKVTGTARYAADAPVSEPLYGVVVQATIPSGRIASIDETATRAVPGVVEVLTYRNATRLKAFPFDFSAPFTEEVAPMQGDVIHYDGQHVAVVVARTFEAAREGATLLTVSYERGPAHFTIDGATEVERPKVWFGDDVQPRRGEPEKAYENAEVRIDATYETPTEHHNPLEPSATIGEWRDGEIVVHDATQWVRGTRICLAKTFDVEEERVRVISPYVGGGFGCKGWYWPHTSLAVMASKLTGKPVKLVLSREQMFTSVGHRSLTRQRIRLGAAHDGALASLMHDVEAESSRVGLFIESAGRYGLTLFDVPNIAVTHRVARLDLPTPTAMRAPGEAPGSFGIGCAIDELAERCGLDPLAVLRRNHTTRDGAANDLPFSSKHLLECYERGAEAFGWEKRELGPRTMRDGGELVGWGVATAMYPALRSQAEARVTIGEDGTIDVASATHDLGTGQYTILAQI